MNLFRSEEHARNWAGFDPASQAAIRPVADIAKAFALPFFRYRLAPDYVLHLREWGPESMTAMIQLSGE